VPPHPVSDTRDRAQTSEISSVILRRRMQMNPNGTTAAINETSGEPAGPEFMRALDEAVIVRVDVLVPVTLAGENAQVTFAGSPEHDSETVCVNPFNPLTLTCVQLEPPADTAIVGDTRESEKSGAGRLIVYVAETTLLEL
jgi:hypothetical protein